MDIFTALILVFVAFILTCVGIVLLADSDILTFLSAKYGKDPSRVYAGKVIWITGASSGIGEAHSKELVRHNAKLVLSARRNNELERVKQLCLEINPEVKAENILILPFDMLDYSEHEDSLNKVLSYFGKLDVLISNAGRSQRASWEEIDLKVDKDVFELNVFSLINLNRVVLKYFLKSGGGQLVINSSIAGIMGVPYSGSYTGSKHALQGYFNGLRNEVRAKNISVTTLLPGPVFSNILSEAFTAEPGKKFEKQHNSNDKRMTAERCAFLSVTAMANEVEEVWLGPAPLMFVAYFSKYCPYMFSKLESLLCKYDYFIKVRDGRNTLKED